MGDMHWDLDQTNRCLSPVPLSEATVSPKAKRACPCPVERSDLSPKAKRACPLSPKLSPVP